MTAVKESTNSVTMSIIVVSYNTREMTLACLRSVVNETTSHSWELCFIDNCSTDGSFEAVEKEFGSDPRFILEKSTENLGFAGGQQRSGQDCSRAVPAPAESGHRGP